MNSRLFILASIIGLAAPAWAQDIDRLQNLAQREFRLLSEDLGGALSYRPLIPTAPLGTTGFDIGIAVTAAKIENEEIVERATSDEAFVPGNVALPAIGLRGNFTKVSGIDQIDFDTRGLDLSISKGFAVATPYAGIGRVWVKSDPKGNLGFGGVTLSKEEFELDKFFIGLGLKFGLFNLNLEADRTGEVTGYSAKVGLRF